MAVYEIVFKNDDGNENVVLTNADPRRERQATRDGVRWDVVKAEPGVDGVEARLTVAVPLKT